MVPSLLISETVLILLMYCVATCTSYASSYRPCARRAFGLHYREPVVAYEGPSSEFKDMVAGCEIADLGLTMMVKLFITYWFSMF